MKFIFGVKVGWNNSRAGFCYKAMEVEGQGLDASEGSPACLLAALGLQFTERLRTVVTGGSGEKEDFPSANK